MTIVPLPGRLLPRSDALEVIYAHGERVVCLRGEHDASTVSALARELAEVMRLDESDLVVDLHDVAFMDSSTVAALTRAGTFLAARGRALRLRVPSDAARRVLTICGLAYDAAAPPRGNAPDLRIVPDEDPA